jgi:hypothetical protein
MTEESRNTAGKLRLTGRLNFQDKSKLVLQPGPGLQRGKLSPAAEFFTPFFFSPWFPALCTCFMEGKES